jgi:hypothetical protein
MGYLRVKRNDPFDGLLHTSFELCPDGLVLTLMFLKPFAVIVGH